MTNLVTLSSLAAGASTLVLAVATFASVRSASRSARTADCAAGRAANPAKARGAAPVGTPQPVAKRRALNRAAQV